ncbi:MAG TPA: SpoIIE family protein phosphatase [Kofleriaceae bacterium]|nr:SpoIIE family protein phosphatase [Kofleriaceae bacterium]
MSGDDTFAHSPPSADHAARHGALSATGTHTSAAAPREGLATAVRRVGRDALRSDFGKHHDELRAAQRDVILSRAAVLIWISVFVMPTAILLFMYFTARPFFATAVWIVVAAIGAVLGLRVALARGVFFRHYHLAMLVLVGGVFGPAGSAIMALAAANGGSFLFAYFLIYFAFTSLFPADAKWIVLTSVAIVTSYLVATVFEHDPPPISNLIYFLELTFIGVVLNRVLCKLFFDEKLARIELRGARDALFAEMEVAQKIQTLLLPREPALPGFALSGMMKPADEVGGDYYDVIETENGRRLIAVGDVSGHGVTTGLTMMMVRASLVSTLESRPDASLAELYMAMNRCLCRNLERMNLRLYMTFALLEHDGGGTFRAVGAHLPALIYRAAKKVVEEVEIAGVWLGVIDQITPDLVPETAIELARGDSMLLLTDGVVEHAGEGGMFGFDRVHAALAGNAELGPAQVIDAVTTQLAAHGGTQDDDMTLLALKYIGEVDGSRVS